MTDFSTIKGMGEPARRAVREAGFAYLEELITASHADLARLHGMGPKALRILADELAARGLGFKAN